MLNSVTIMGRIVRDPELRQTNTGTAVTSFTIACEKDFSSDGKKQADFIDIVAWRNTAEFICKYFGKGRMIIVSGRLQSRKWMDNDGNNRTGWEVVAENVYFGDSKPVSERKLPKEEEDWTQITDEDDDFPL